MDNEKILEELEKFIENGKLEKYQQNNIKGWVCPVCGRGLSPCTSICPCVVYTPPCIPTQPQYPYPSPWYRYEIISNEGYL